MKTDVTLHDVMAGAFQALLRGDTATRDKLCKVAERTMGVYTECAGDVLVDTKDLKDLA